MLHAKLSDERVAFAKFKRDTASKSAEARAHAESKSAEAEKAGFERGMVETREEAERRLRAERDA